MEYHYAVFAILSIITLNVIIRDFQKDLLSFKEEEEA